jgi:hypothetical protein
MSLSILNEDIPGIEVRSHGQRQLKWYDYGRATSQAINFRISPQLSDFDPRSRRVEFLANKMAL